MAALALSTFFEVLAGVDFRGIPRATGDAPHDPPCYSNDDGTCPGSNFMDFRFRTLDT